MQLLTEEDMELDQFIKCVVQPSCQQKVFFHFTDERNLPSIRKHGLLSTQRLRQRNIDIPAPGGNQWSMDADQQSGMDAYVHLCFKTGHPMEYPAINEGRIEQIFYLRVDPSVIKLPEAMITNDVSNKRGVSPQSANRMLDEIDLEVLYERTNWNDPVIQERLKAAEKFELLIPDHVPVAYITNLGNG